MEVGKITAKSREDMGTHKSRTLRSRGAIPAVIYGHKKKTLHLEVPENEALLVLRAGHHIVDLEHGGGVERAVIKEIQYDTLTEKVLHIDFARIAAGEKIRVELPFKIVGTPVGAKEGGVLQQELEMVEVECLPEEMPDAIEVNVAEMKMNDIIYVSALPQIEGLKYLTDAKHVVVHVLPPRKEEEVVAAAPEEAAAKAEPEVITERKEAEEPEEEEKKKGGKKAAAPQAEKGQAKPAEKGQAKPQAEKGK
jgi:large subunit ribosomal protein L25